MQLLISSPHRGSEAVYETFRLAFRRARNAIRLVTAYFVPDSEALAEITGAARRGVTVQIMVPGQHNDRPSVRHAARACWGELLDAGVEIYVYQPTMLHAKAMLIDHNWVIVGSANFDNRSFALNDEVLLNVVGEEFFSRQFDLFRKDLEECREITREQWQRRGAIARCQERLAGLIRSQL